MKRKEKPRKPKKPSARRNPRLDKRDSTPDPKLTRKGGLEPNSLPDPRPGLKPWSFDSGEKSTVAAQPVKPEFLPQPISEPPTIEESVKLEAKAEIMGAVRTLDCADDLARVLAAIKIIERFEMLGSKEASELKLEDIIENILGDSKSDAARSVALDWLIANECISALKRIAGWRSRYTEKEISTTMQKLESSFDQPAVCKDSDFLFKIITEKGYDSLRAKALHALEAMTDELLKGSVSYQMEHLLEFSQSEETITKIVASFVQKDHISYVKSAAEKNELVKKIYLQQLKRQVGLLMSCSNPEAIRKFLNAKLPEEIESLMVSRLIAESKNDILLDIMQYVELKDAQKHSILDYFISTKNLRVLAELAKPDYHHELNEFSKRAMSSLCGMVDTLIGGNEEGILAMIACFGFSEGKDKAIKHFMDKGNSSTILTVIRHTKDIDTKRKLLEHLLSVDERNAVWRAASRDGVSSDDFKLIIDILRTRKSCDILLQLCDSRNMDYYKKAASAALETLVEHMKTQKLLKPLIYVYRNGSSEPIKNEALEALFLILEENLDDKSIEVFDVLFDYRNQKVNDRAEPLLDRLVDLLADAENLASLEKIGDKFGFPNKVREKAKWKVRWMSIRDKAKRMLERLKKPPEGPRQTF